MIDQKNLTSYLPSNLSHYEAVLDRYVAIARAENPGLSTQSEAGIRLHFSEMISKGKHDTNDMAKHMAKMTVSQIAAHAKRIPDKLSARARMTFTNAATRRHPNMRWDNLFKDGSDNIYLPLSHTAKSTESSIDAYLEMYNQQTEINYQNAKAEEDALVSSGELNPNWRKAGRASQPGQRQLRRDPANPAKLQSLNRTPKPGKDAWEPGQRLGAFLEAQHQWALLDEFEFENSRKASLEHGLGDKADLRDAQEILWGKRTAADNYNPQTLMVVISRDPQKIGEMSSGQHWGSCMSEGGVNFDYVRHDIEQGSLVAYVTSTQDPDARYPLMRQLLKPFRNETGATILVPAITYGAEDADNSYTRNALHDTLSQFVKENVNQNATGTFTMDRALYRDGQASTVFFNDFHDPENIYSALSDFFLGALQERIVEYDSAKSSQTDECLVTQDPEKYARQIRPLFEPKQLARQFYKELRKITIAGAMPTPEEILSLLPGEHTKTDFYEKLLQEANTKFPQQIIEGFIFYKKQPYAESVFRQAIKCNRDGAEESLRHMDQYIDQPYAEEVIRKAVESSPADGLYHASSYVDQAYGQELIYNLVKRNPEITLEWFEAHQPHERRHLFGDPYKAPPEWFEQLEDIAKEEIETRKRNSLTSHTSFSFNQDSSTQLVQHEFVLSSTYHKKLNPRNMEAYRDEWSFMQDPYRDNQRVEPQKTPKKEKRAPNLAGKQSPGLC